MHQSTQVLLLVSWCLMSNILAGPTSRALLGHSFNKRSFFNLECKGVYDKSIFAKLDRICEDCYNLFREPQLHSQCRSGCFTSEFFEACLEALLLKEEEMSIYRKVGYLREKRN
nr:PREDICTED: ion transport peptide isoform X2 [Bemisia tabaci]